MDKRIIHARKIININSNPTDVEIMKYIKDNEEDMDNISFTELKKMIRKIQVIDTKRNSELIDLDEVYNDDFEEEYKPFKFEMKKIKDIMTKKFKVVKNKIENIDVDKIKKVIKEIRKSMTITSTKIYKQIMKYKPKTYEIVVMYKKKVQKEIDFSEGVLKQKGVTQQEIDRAEKKINRLKNINKFNDNLYPILPMSQMMVMSLKFIIYDIRAMAILIFLNSYYIIKYMINSHDVFVTRNILFSIIVVNVIFSFFYAIIIFRKIGEFVQENNLKDFMWKEFPNGIGVETEYYSLFNESDGIIRDRQTEEGFDFSRKRVRPLPAMDNEENDVIKYQNALALWNEQYFKESFLRALPIEEKNKNEYITKFSFKVPLELELATVERKIPEYARYSGKNTLHTETSIKRSTITLFIEEKALPTMVNFDDDKIDKNSDTRVYVGEAFDGSVYLDFDENPHMLIGGSTGCGKGVTQNVILTQLTQKGEVIIMDLSTKAGADYSYYKEKGYRIVTELEETLHFFKGLQEEASIRMEIFRSKGKNKLSAYNQSASEEEKIYRKFIIIDEYAALKRVDKDDEDEAKEIEKTIIALGEQARAVGIHIIIATQNAKATIINTELRNNLMLRVVGRCSDFNASNVFLENDFASIKRNPPLIKPDDTGRFIVSGASTKDRLAINNHFTVQVPFVEFAGNYAEEHIEKYGHLVELPKKSRIIENYKKMKTVEIQKNNKTEIEKEAETETVKEKTNVIPIINEVEEEIEEVEIEELDIEDIEDIEEDIENDIYNVFEEKKPSKDDFEDLFN